MTGIGPNNHRRGQSPTPKKEPPENQTPPGEEPRDIEAELEDYPDDCAVCGWELDSPHPDDPPVHSGECEDIFFSDHWPPDTFPKKIASDGDSIDVKRMLSDTSFGIQVDEDNIGPIEYIWADEDGTLMSYTPQSNLLHPTSENRLSYLLTRKNLEAKPIPIDEIPVDTPISEGESHEK